ncbi:SBBP repeat-containing protein [Fluviicola sp.]|uniref:SBBP repeat-containing protein n=1 Tax=Fluviicola sp. TaxID=1917219 RepID=UPI0031D719D5
MKHVFVTTYLIFLSTTLCFNLSYSQYYSWAKPFLGGGSNDSGQSIAVDASGNVYTTGYFEATVDFDPGPGVNSVISNGATDIFISKLNASGNLVWTKILGGYGANYAYSIALDASGNVYVTGDFEGTIDLDPGPGTSSFTANGTSDVFVCKLNNAGNFVWGKTIGSSYADYGRALALDASGNVYFTGYYQGTIDSDPGSGTNNITSQGSYDVFITKLDASGNFVWGKSLGGSGDDRGYAIQVSASGNVYTSGSFNATADFDPGTGTSSLTSVGAGDVFISKLSSAGTFIWAKTFGGSNTDIGRGIAVDASENVFITGYFWGDIDLDPSSGAGNFNGAGFNDLFISKMDASGNYVWGKAMGSIGDDQGLSIAVDNSGALYVTGYYAETVDFDPNAGTSYLTSQGLSEVYVCKYTSAGNVVWAKSIGGVGEDRGKGIYANSSGNVYATGTFQGTVDFDPGASTANLTAGNIDVFVLKMGPCENVTASVTNNTITSNNTGTSYQWVNCNNGNAPISGATSQSYTPTVNGSYAVIVTSGTCSMTSNCVTISWLGLEENSFSANITFYPNPTSGILNITSDETISMIEVYNLQGQLLKQQSSDLKMVDISEYQSGIYFVKLIASNGLVFSQNIEKVD